jgi:electron transfer flavoprotein beta subunit
VNPGNILRKTSPEPSVQKILVGLKRALDYSIRVKVKPDGSGVVIDGAKMSINPFDEIALEAALRLREQGAAQEVVVVSIGTAECQQQLRTGLAMGADRAILVSTELALEPLAVAKVLLAIARSEDPDLVILGKQSIDSDNNQTGQMLAALWDRPQATFASHIDYRGDRLMVTREVDAGLEVVEVELPAVVTTDLRLNEPRYVKLPEIMKAKKKPLATLDLASMNIDVEPTFTVLATIAPAPRPRGRMVKDVAELVAALRQKGVLP